MNTRCMYLNCTIRYFKAKFSNNNKHKHNTNACEMLKKPSTDLHALVLVKTELVEYLGLPIAGGQSTSY